MTKWRPGFRRPPPGLKATFSKYLLAVGDMGGFKMFIFKNPPETIESDVEDDTQSEIGENVQLILNRPNGTKAISLNLCFFTEEELRLLVHGINVAVLEALPIVQERDRVAKEAADNGTDVFFRSHRGAPRLSFPKRQVGPNNTSIQNRSEDVLAGDGTIGDRTSEPGKAGGPVAQ